MKSKRPGKTGAEEQAWQRHEALVGGSGEGGLAAALWEVGSNRMSWLLWIRSSGKGNPVFPGFRL